MSIASSSGSLKQKVEKEGVKKVMAEDGKQAGLRSWKSLHAMLRSLKFIF